MTTPRRLLQLLACAAVAGSLLAGNARAKGSKADKKGEYAMNDLFSSAKFDEAKAALAETIADCGSCSKHTLAVLHVDLGIVFITGFQDKKRGAAEMRKARALDPSLSLDPAFVTPEVQSVFDAAGTGSGAADAASAGGPVSPLEKEVVLEDEPDDHAKKKKKKRPPAAAEPREASCTTNDDCDADERCRKGACVARAAPDEAPPPRVTPAHEHAVWLSVGLIQDFGFASGSELCTRTSQVSSANTCLRASGSQYHGTPTTNNGGKLGLGPSVATTRLTLATYFAVSSSLSLGLRVGYAFAGGGPTPDGGKPFLPVHAELQGAYWLSDDALSTQHIGPFLELSGGVAQMSAHGSARVEENLSLLPDGTRAFPPPANQIDNPPSQMLDVYQTSGSAFAGAGAGLFLPFGGGSALLLDARLSVFFPTSGAALSLGLGGAFGL